MPGLASWRDFLPPDASSARNAADDALASARKHSYALTRLEPGRAFAGLYEGAAEAMRAEVLFDSHVAGRVAGEYDKVRRIERTDLGLDGVVGESAFAALSGAEIDATRIEALAGVGHLPLAYVALAAGRADLARALTTDARVHALASATEARNGAPFLDAVEEFPSADGVGYAELACISRAYVTQIEGMPPERASRWVRRIVHEGRDAVRPQPARVVAPAPYVPPPIPPIHEPAPTPEQAAMGARLFGRGPPAGAWTGWSHVVIADVEGLRGGAMVSVSSSGEVFAVDVQPWKIAFQYRGWLRDEALARLADLLMAHDPRGLPDSTRMGIPGEALVQLTFVVNGEACTRRRWSGDRSAGFDVLKNELRHLGLVLSSTTRATAVGRWNGSFQSE